MTQIVDALRAIVGPTHVISGDEVAQLPSHFWDPSPLKAMAVVKPANTDEVSQIMKLCFDSGQSVITHGGLTGLVGGEICTPEDIALSLARMNRIENLDTVGRTMTVEAGVVLHNVQSTAEQADLLYALDLGARGSCTIGGNIATNAGGLSVLRYGMTRDQILGLEAVLADGTIVSSMNSMMKNNAGYDLKQLFIGSEGTLGIVTRAVLRLRPSTPHINSAILGFENFEQITTTLRYLSKTMNGQLNAFEVLWNRFYQLATDETITDTVRPPLSKNFPLYAIVETRGSNAEQDALLFEQALEHAMEQHYFVDAMIPQSEKERTSMWAIRENVDIIMRHRPLFVYDVSLPIADMQTYVTEIEQQLKAQWPDVAFYSYGHLADGNLHITVAPDPSAFDKPFETIDTTMAAQHAKWHSISNDIVYAPLQKLGGSISAEHGIGLSKKPYLPLSRNEQEISLMQSLKKALDPTGILNPGKIL